MNLDIKANQWYRTRGGEIVFVIGVNPYMTGTGVETIAAVTKDGDIYTYFNNGLCFKDSRNPSDLIEHLPECDSFYWIPKPQYEMWDFYSMPIGVKVQNKTTGEVYMALPTQNNVFIMNGGSFTYKHLFEQYTQLDGTPCGKKVS